VYSISMTNPTITISKGRFKNPCHTTYTSYLAQAQSLSKVDMVNLMQNLIISCKNKEILKDYFLPPMPNKIITVSVWGDEVERVKKVQAPLGTVKYEFDYIDPDSIQIQPTAQHKSLLGFKAGKPYTRKNETWINAPGGCEKCEAKPYKVNRDTLQWYDSNNTGQPGGFLNTPATFYVFFNTHYKFKEKVNSKEDPQEVLYPYNRVGLWSAKVTRRESTTVNGYIGSKLYLMYQDMEQTSSTCECYPS